MKNVFITILILFFGLSAFADEYCTITQIFYGNNVHKYTDFKISPVTERISAIGNRHFKYNPDGSIWHINGESVSYSNGRITSIGNKYIKYEPDGKISSIGGESVSYSNGRITSIGNKNVKYDPSGEIWHIGNDSVSYQQMKD